LPRGGGACHFNFAFEGDAGIIASEDKLAAEFAREQGAIPAGSEPVKRWLETRFDVGIASKLYRQGAVVDTIEVSTTWTNAAPLYHAMQKAMLEVEGRRWLPGTILMFTRRGRRFT